MAAADFFSNPDSRSLQARKDTHSLAWRCNPGSVEGPAEEAEAASLVAQTDGCRSSVAVAGAGYTVL